MTRIVLAVLAALLALPAVAQAAPAGSTLLQSRSSGFDPFLAGGAANSSVSRFAVSADGCRIAFSSESNALSAADNDRHLNVYLRDVCAGTTTLVSRASNGGPGGNGQSTPSAISPDGRWVAFNSRSSNLVAGVSGNDVVYLHDTASGTTTVVSREGTKLGFSADPPVVANGGKVAFAVQAPLLPEDKNGAMDVYLRDGATLTLISRGDGDAFGQAGMPAISADGSAIAFATPVSLTAADANTTADVYVKRDGVLHLVSRADTASGAAAGGAGMPALSADGTTVAFTTTSSLDAADTNALTDVYRRKGDTTTLVGRRDGATAGVGDAATTGPSIDASGDRIAFLSNGRNLVSPNEPASSTTSDLFVRDVPAGTTQLVSRPGAAGNPDGARNGAITPAGTHTVMTTLGTGMVSGDDDDFSQAVMRRLSDGETQQVSRPDGTGAWSGGGVNASSGGVNAVSRNGRYVAFVSESDALLAGDNDAILNAYVRDNKTGATTQVNVTAAGAPGSVSVMLGELAISDDGRKVAFVTSDRLDPVNDVNGYNDAYVRDLVDGTTYVASRPTGAAGKTLNSTGHTHGVSISGDGSRVGFATTAPLDAQKDTAFQYDVYVRDTGAPHVTTLVSRDAEGNALNDWSNSAPSLDADGSRIAFVTNQMLDAAHETHLMDDVYLYDLDAGTTELVSRATGADTNAGNQASAAPSISADGMRVAFQTQSNFGNGATGSFKQVHLRDLAAHTTVLVSREPGQTGQQGGGESRTPSISADGRRVAFGSSAANLGGPGASVWVRDLDQHTNTLVNAVDGSTTPSSEGAHTPGISASGDCVAFATRSANVVSGFAPGDFDQVFLRAASGDCPDESTPTTTITGAPERTDGASAAFTFTASERATFECRRDAGAWTACASGVTWDDVPEGARTFSVRATDAAGNVEDPVATVTFDVDRTAPVTTLTGPPGRTRETSAEVTFGANEDARFQCRIDDGGWEDCDPDTKAYEDLAEGEHVIQVRAIDLVGNTDATPAEARFVIDRTGPATAIGAIEAADDGSATITFSSEAGATFRCAVDGGELAPCTSPLKRGGLAAGAHTVRVEATDDLGNAGAVAERAFTVPAKPVVEKEPKGGTTTPGGTTTATVGDTTGGGTSQSGPTPGTGPAPRSTPAGTRARIVRTTVKRGVAIVTLSCPASAKAGCKGAVALSAKKLGVVARRSYTVKAGKKATLRLKLKGKARKAKKVTARAA